VNGSLSLHAPSTAPARHQVSIDNVAIRLAQLVVDEGGHKRINLVTIGHVHLRWQAQPASRLSNLPFGLVHARSRLPAQGDSARGTEPIEKLTPAARDARHDRADGNRQHGRDFGVGKLFHVS
jgi:hypothetical protein